MPPIADAPSGGVIAVIDHDDLLPRQSDSCQLRARWPTSRDGAAPESKHRVSRSTPSRVSARAPFGHRPGRFGRAETPPGNRVLCYVE
jgi:hypothetical protein